MPPSRRLPNHDTASLSRHIPLVPNGPIPESSASASRTRIAQHRQLKRTNVTVACDRCKEKRTRCDGQKPCASCLKLESNCSYGQARDGRRIRSSSAQERIEQYRKLLHLMCTAPANDAVRILFHLRSSKNNSSDTPDDVEDHGLVQALRFAESLASLAATPESVESPVFQSWTTTPSSSSDGAPMTLPTDTLGQLFNLQNDLVDPLLLQVIPTDWKSALKF